MPCLLVGGGSSALSANRSEESSRGGGGETDVFIQTNNALSRQFRGLSDKYVDVETNVTNPVDAQQLKGRPAAQ